MLQTLWMFGGEFHVEHDQPGLGSDLWKYDLFKGTWEMAHNGSSKTNNVPAARQLAAGCGVIGSYLVLYGGLGSAGGHDEKDVPLDDTWIFNIADKHWYTLEEFRAKVGAENSTATPGARGDMASWCTDSHELMVFGGFDKGNGLHNDLWIFNMQTLQWKLSDRSSGMPKDNQFVSHLPYPVGRSGATTWSVKNDLFMFGGNIDPKNGRSKHLMVGNVNEMWRYGLDKDEWTFLSGERHLCTRAGSYGELGVASKSNAPGCRRRAAGWVDVRSNLWMFGGDGVDSSQESVTVFQHSKLLSDIWYFNRYTHLWVWKGGDKVGDLKGQFGDKGERSRNYHPGGRSEPVAWGAFSKFYLLGGIGHDKDGKDGYLDDIWELDPRSDPSIMKNKPYPGPVFTVIFFGLGLMVFMAVLYLLESRYHIVRPSVRGRKYTQIPVDIPDE